MASAAVLLVGTPVIPVECADAETKLIALTFDDGPNTTTTNDVLDLLAEYDAKASFFLIGDNINEESAVTVKRAYDMGMEINNHSKTHPNMANMTPEEIEAEVSYVDEKVLEITGEPTKFFRPPFIDTSQTMYDTIDLPFICGIDCQDYMENVTAEQRAAYILDGARDGIIVLLHDAAGNTQTVDALKIAMPELIEQGYEFVTLTELFERQGETPKDNILYTCVAKYPCADYTLYQELSAEAPDRVVLDASLLETLGDGYAVEVDYTTTDAPPVIALQKWSGTPTVWHTIQPFYFNGDRAVFLASDILAALEEVGVGYADLDGINVTAYGGELTLSDAKLLVRGESTETVMGDVSKDGVFNLNDLIMLQKWLLCAGTLNDWKAGDFDGNAVIDGFDLAWMKRNLLHPQE